MKKPILFYLMISLFCFLDCVNIGYCGKSIEETDSANLKKMEELAFWFIETGLGQYYERKGKNNYKLRPGDEGWLVDYPDAVWISDYVEERGYSDGLPQIEKDGRIARIIIGFDHYSLMNITECFLRSEYKKEIYEYWAIKQSTFRRYQNETDYVPIKFVIAKASALNGKRTILHTSNQFFEKYEIDKEFSVVFPMDDLKILYFLGAWFYPDNFKSSDLKNFQVLAIGGRKYKKGPWPPPPPPKRFWEFWK